MKRYESVIGREEIKRLRKAANPLRGKRIVMVNSARHGGGVAELLGRLAPLFRDLGIRCTWQTMDASPAFFGVTKKIHNLLQGGTGVLSSTERNIFLTESHAAGKRIHGLASADLVVIHDPQPIALVERRASNSQPWIWRCHIDASHPNPSAMAFIRPFANQYDRMIVSHPSYRMAGVRTPMSVIHPAIDPLAPKNAPLNPKLQKRLLEGHGVDLSLPFIAQISRYDRWKDPVGVLRIFRMVRKRIPCRLILVGNTADDDPEGKAVYDEMAERCGRDRDVRLFLNVTDNDRFVNAVQSSAAVIIQKSIREGFGLTVAEAMYKGTPVVASRVGGIPLQIKNGADGFLCDPKQEHDFADHIVRLLEDSRLRERMGKLAHEKISRSFLITTLVERWIELFKTSLKIS